MIARVFFSSFEQSMTRPFFLKSEPDDIISSNGWEQVFVCWMRSACYVRIGIAFWNARIRETIDGRTTAMSWKRFEFCHLLACVHVMERFL